MVLLLLLSGQPIAGTIVFASLVLPSLVGLAILIWIGERARKSPSPARAAVSAALFAAALFAASLIVIVGLHLAGCGRF
jgi:hypothetical protein